MGKVAQLFLGGISRSAGVISSDARGLLANVRAIVWSLPFGLGSRRLQPNEDRRQRNGPCERDAHANFELLPFPQRASAANG
jgi:hypothetical protein